MRSTLIDFPRRVATVSYTHLDVYKRQIHDCTISDLWTLNLGNGKTQLLNALTGQAQTESIQLWSYGDKRSGWHSNYKPTLDKIGERTPDKLGIFATPRPAKREDVYKRQTHRTAHTGEHHSYA